MMLFQAGALNRSPILNAMEGYPFNLQAWRLLLPVLLPPPPPPTPSAGRRETPATAVAGIFNIQKRTCVLKSLCYSVFDHDGTSSKEFPNGRK